MTFKEISAWIVALAMGFVVLKYVEPLAAARTIEVEGGLGVIAAVIAFIFIVVLGHIVVGIFAPKKSDEAEDERDRRIELYAEYASGYVLGAVMLGGLAYALVHEDQVYVNIFFLGLVGSEIFKNLCQIVLYRRGA